MKFEKVSLKKSWTAPVLRALPADHESVRIASALDPRFASAMKAQSSKT